MNLKNSILSEETRSQKSTYYLISFICNVQNRQIRRDKKQVSGFQGLGTEEMGNY